MAMTALGRRKTVRWLGWPALIVATCYVALLLYVQLSERLIRHQAERLLDEMRELQVGKNTWTDLQRIATQWGAWGGYEGTCTKEHCDYRVALSDVARDPRFALLVSRLGHGHLASAFLTVTVDKGFVTQTSFRLWVQVPKGYGTRWEREQPQQPGYVPYSTGDYTLIARASSRLELSHLCCYWPNAVPHTNYVVSKPSGCEGCLAIWTEFLPQAAPEEKLRLTAFNLECITKWKPCADEEDIMPGAGTEYQQQNHWRAIESGRQEQCSYSIPELSKAALNAAVARVLSVREESSNINEGVKLRLIKKLAGNEDLNSNETIEFGVPTESKQHKLVSETFTDRKQLIVLYWRDPSGNTLQIYTCGLLPDNEKIEKYVTYGVSLGKGLREYE